MLVLDLFCPLLRTARISSLCHGRKRTRMSDAIVSLPRASSSRRPSSRSDAMTVAMDQMRAANAQRSYLLFFVLFFLLLTANDFTPAKTRRNARTGSGIGGEGANAVTPKRRDEVRDKVRARRECSIPCDLTTLRSTRLTRASMTFPRVASQVIIDLSESNSRLEVENRRLRASAIGLREALMKRGGEAEVKEFDDAYNLTSLIASSRNVGDEGGVPQLVKREASERGSTDDAENEIPTAVKSSRRLLGRLDSEHTDLHPSWR